MRITSIAHDSEGLTDRPATVVLRDGARVTSREQVQVEHSLDLYINEILTMRIVCSPDHLEQLVVGRLLSSGIITSVDDIEELCLYASGTRMRVILSKEAAARADFSRKALETVPTCCTGNRLINVYFEDSGEPEKVQPIPWEPAWVFTLARAFADDSPMHRATSGAHSCYLAVGGKQLYCCEDLGRHNAFDKVIGCALMDGVDLRQAVVFTSGRLPVDMVLKAIRSGIPVIATKATPTDMTIELAEHYDLTLICQARPDSMKIYNDPMAR